MAELSKLNSMQATPEEKLFQSRSFQGFKNKAMGWAIALGMLPILGIGSALYYFGNQAIDRQITEAKREGATQLAATTLIQQKEQLALLLLGTGGMALLSGAIAALGSNRTLRSAMTAAAVVNAQAARQNRSEGAQQFADAIYAIRHARTQTDILRTAVEEVRQALNSDRVIVYALEPNGAGTVIAESVETKWPKALRARIDDPCFSSQYTESYQHGRVKAIDDIYAAGLTPCHIEQLEAFAVRANLVAPILNGDQLFGLLIAHQCASPRVWRQFEIDLFTQSANHVGISLDNARFQAQAANEAKLAQAFRADIHRLYESLSQPDILQTAVDACRKMVGVDRVIVCTLDPEVGGVVMAESVAKGWPKLLKTPIRDPYLGDHPVEVSQTGWVKVIEDIYAADLPQAYMEQLDAFAVKAYVAAPILKQGVIFGLLIAQHCSASRAWQPFETRWFSQLAAQVGFALDTAALFAENTTLQQEADHEIEWKAFLTDATRQIHSSLDREDVLKSAVEESRRVLACDRVVIYSVDRESKGVVIAESVGGKWPRALGRTIEDPCFEARYIKKYENGRVRALNNIYEGGMTQCYIDQLEVLSVKANLVAPVLHEGKLLGLLVAHQCSGPRVWKPLEIGWFTQIAVQVGYALDNAKLVGRVTEMAEESALETEWKTFFMDSTRQIHASLSREDVLKSAVEEARRVLTCDRVVIYSVDRESQGVVISESVGGNWPKALGRTIEDPCFEARYIKKYENGRVRALNNIYESGLTQCYIDQLEVLSVKANLVAPVLHEGKLLGLLVAHQCSGPRAWKELEIGWFTQIAVQVGYALDNAKLVGRVTEMAQEAALETEWKTLFMDATRQIHASLSREDVLISAVQEARRVLTCDRVVIYSVDRESKGIVIAESVGDNWPQALGRIIEDPCFEARYIKQYENGRVRALNNIYQAGMTQCYIDQLEILAVKANLVAPVLHEGKLLGLIVAHQCSGPRVWKQLEIDWFTQIAVQVGYALDNAKLVGHVNQMAEEAAREVEWQTFFMDATRQIHASLSREDVLKTAVEEARRVLTCDRAVIYSVDRQSQGVVIAESVGANWPQALGRTIEDPCFEARYIKKYENGRVRALNNIYEGGLTQCYIDQLEVLAVKANLVVPVLHEGKLMGLLVAHQCSGPRDWKSLEIGWFTQLAVQVGYALDNAKLIGRVNEMSLEAEIQQQMAVLLKDSEFALKTLSEEAQSQTETVETAIAQIQTVTESAQEMVTTAHQAELQIQKTDQTIQIGHELISQTVDSISILQEIAMGAAAKSKKLGQSSQQIAKALTLINELTLQMNQQVMNVAITAGRTGEGGQMSVLSVAETIRSLSQQLAETTAVTEPLVLEIEAEANSLAADMEVGAEQALTETELTKETQNKLGEIAAVSAKMSMLVGKMAQAAAGQVKTSTAASRAALNVANFAHHTSEQSAAVVKSLTTLTLPEAESQPPEPNS